MSFLVFRQIYRKGVLRFWVLKKYPEINTNICMKKDS